MLSLRRVAMAGIALAGLAAFSLVPATPSLASWSAMNLCR
jgi:hypothetical protein